MEDIHMTSKVETVLKEEYAVELFPYQKDRINEIYDLAKNAPSIVR